MSVTAPAATATTLGGVELNGALGGGTDATNPTIPAGYVTAAMLAQAYALATDLTAETNRAEAAESSITTNYEAAVNAEISARTTAVSSEATTRANADTGLSNSITTLNGDIATLNGDITTINGNITTETNARIAGDSTNASNISANTTAINNEVARAEAAEALKFAIANNLSEITAVPANTATNQAAAQTNLGLGSAATHASTAFDTAGAAATVQTNLNAEISRAEGAEGTLTTNLNTEITNRTNGDNARLVIANNLSEIATAGSTAQTAARGNLGLGTAATFASTAFDAAGTSAAETTRAEGVEATKADDNAVVHLAGTETVTGLKNFTGGLESGGSAVVITTDARLSDARDPLAGSVSDTSIVAGGLTNASISATAAIAYTKLDATTQTAITKADSAAQSVNGRAAVSGVVTLTAADLSAIATDVLVNKGDLLVGQGASASSPFSVGANNTVLIADSTQGQGVRWGNVVLWPTIESTQQTAPYTFALTDAGTVVESTDASAITFTIPTNATVAFPVGTIIEVFQDGAGQVTIAGAAGVTLRSPGSLVHTAAQYATIRLRQRATDEWVLSGDLA